MSLLADSETTQHHRAEKKPRKKIVHLPDNLDSLPVEEARYLLHELHVYQVELKTQNEELRLVQEKLAASQKHYSDLFDLAPGGLLTFSQQGLIQEVNLAEPPSLPYSPINPGVEFLPGIGIWSRRRGLQAMSSA